MRVRLNELYFYIKHEPDQNMGGWRWSHFLDPLYANMKVSQSIIFDSSATKKAVIQWRKDTRAIIQTTHVWVRLGLTNMAVLRTSVA